MKQIITTLSFRGGTGKSTVVSNMAATLAENGNKVIIIDTDIQSPGMNAMFGLEADSVSETLSDYLKGSINIEEAVYDVSDIVQLKQGKIFLVPGSMSYGELADQLMQKKKHNLIRKAVESLVSSFDPDYVIIDSHPGINEEVMLTASFSDVVFNILRPDNQDYQGAQVTSSLLKKLEVNTYFLLNRVHKKINVKELEKKLVKSFGLPVAGALPFSEEILFAESSFIFSHKYPHHNFSKEVQRIAMSVFDEKPHERLGILHGLLELVKKKKVVSEPDLYKSSKLAKGVFVDSVKELRIDKFLKSSEQKGKTMFSLTAKGQDFLANYGRVSDFVGKFRL